MSAAGTLGGPQVETLVGRLTADMLGRGLQAGDPYLTSSQAGELLGVSRATAYRALRLLAERKILVARDRSGMFVTEHGAKSISSGEPLRADGGTRIKQIYVLEPSDRPSNGVRFDQLMIGLRGEFRGATISFIPLPSGREVEFLRNLVTSAGFRSNEAAFIPISVPEPALDLLAEQQRWPVAVLGSVARRLEAIASVDADQCAGGCLLADYLLSRGHRRILAIMNEVWRQGDHAFFDAMQERLANDSLPANALTVRGFRFQRDEIMRGITHVMEHPKAPTAIVCRYPDLVPMVEAAVQHLKIFNGSEIEIVFDSAARGQAEFDKYAHTEPCYSFTEYGQELARMLRAMELRKNINERHVALPVELRQPVKIND